MTVLAVLLAAAVLIVALGLLIGRVIADRDRHD